MKIGETVKVEYVEVEIAGDHYIRYSPDHWVWLIGESTETVGPNECESYEKAYQERVGQKEWEREATEQQEKLQPTVPVEFFEEQGHHATYSMPTRPSEDDMMSKPNVNVEISQDYIDALDKYAEEHTFEEIEMELSKSMQFNPRGSGKTETMSSRVAFFTDALATKYSKNYEVDKESGSQLEQFTDIGLRVDRYGNMVFKPELVK